eukprot:jgi/Bigna1/140491/aug1.56_g15199
MKSRKKLKPASIFSLGASSSSTPSIGVKGKKYGLVKPKKKKPVPSIFSTEDSDDDDEEGNQPIDYNLLKYRKQKVKRDRQKALAEDPTVFQYDEVFEDIQGKRADKAAAIKKEKRQRKSRYIENLVKKAKEREIEQAIIEERVLLKERERDDDLYGDKQKYVTGAYKKELKKRELWMKERDRLDAIDEIKAEAMRKGKISNMGLMSHILSRKSADEEDENMVTIEERVVKELEAREQREKLEKARRKEERRKTREAESRKRSSLDVAKAALARYGVEQPEKKSKTEADKGQKAEPTVTSEIKADATSRGNEKAASSDNAKPKEQVILKRNTGDKVLSAKERYLARKKAKQQLAEKLGKA